ncbi:hypothetical protein [Flavobacterium muglaense]|uniref:Uncharacterized protein n=1 Tax=Flavobacterium muglaense TaxID=2764716 RepID=A0A923N1Z0_9FLAO|nr:hypothetical protein [Flavobacterium muglaense]MBC5837676.1 hypothetical protein [Flavobacterium muglaense]MBC5844208.1 hypothetical protein [Flavobacterium muglaense]
MKKLFSLLCIFINLITYSQNEINWDGKYNLQLSDFKSASTQIGGVQINNIMMPIGFEFSIMMSNVEFMFTKNFNSKVGNSFNREAASIIAVDEATAKYLVNFAQYGFDLTELYARKLRKKIYDDKKTLSNVSFLKPIYDDFQRELNEKLANASKETDLGKSQNKLATLHQQVMLDIAELSDFCKECKPLKKK